MKLLVTGGEGFIGSSFISYMMKKHMDLSVVNVDKKTLGNGLKISRGSKDNKRYRFTQGDITDFDLVAKIIQDVDAVVNFAAETHVDRSIADPQPFMHTNVQGTFTLLEAVRRFNKSARFVHVSTDEVYGGLARGSFRDDAKLKPSNPYAATKAAADMLALSYHRTYGLNILITRCTNNFGPFQFPEKLIPKAIIRAIKNLPIPLYGSGKNIRDWMYVVDHCEALDIILRKGRGGEVYNISAGNELSNMDVVQMILKKMGKPEEQLLSFVEDRPGHDIRYSLDSSKLREELGWKPKHDFNEALETTIGWYMNNEWWWSPLATEETLHPTPWKLG